MNEDIDALSVRIERLLSMMKKLSDDNVRLRSELASTVQEQEQMQQRMQEARTRVEAALARLPEVSQPNSEEPA